VEKHVPRLHEVALAERGVEQHAVTSASTATVCIVRHTARREQDRALMRTAFATRTGVLAGGRAAFDLLQAAVDNPASAARRYACLIVVRSSFRSTVGCGSGPSG
jgi:hypothetical protein